MHDAVVLLMDAMAREGWSVGHLQRGLGCFDADGEPHDFHLEIKAARK